MCAKSVARGSHCLVCVVGVDSRVCCAVSGASRRAGTPLGLFPGVCGVRVVVLLCLSVVLAAGSRPVPFRTRKLSLPAPMVLHPGGCGRVGHRRHFSLCVVGWCHPFTACVVTVPVRGWVVTGLWGCGTTPPFLCPCPPRGPCGVPRPPLVRSGRGCRDPVRPPGGEESRNARVPGALWPARRRPVEKRSGVRGRESARRAAPGG